MKLKFTLIQTNNYWTMYPTNDGYRDFIVTGKTPEECKTKMIQILSGELEKNTTIVYTTRNKKLPFENFIREYVINYFKVTFNSLNLVDFEIIIFNDKYYCTSNISGYVFIFEVNKYIPKLYFDSTEYNISIDTHIEIMSKLNEENI